MHITPPYGETFDVRNGTLLLLPAGTKADFSFNKKRCNYSASCEIENFSYDLKKQKNTIALFEDLPLAIKIDGKDFDFIHEIFKRAEKLANSPIEKNRSAAEILLCSILSEFIRQFNNSNEKIPQTVLKLREALDADSDCKCTIYELMSGVACSAGHLRRQFKEYYKISIADYRSKIRLAKIKSLMLDYDLNMKEIADLAGMKNVTHLHKFIKKHCNMTPKELRKSLGR